MGIQESINFSKKTELKKGEEIFREGTFGDWVYMVLSGKVEISVLEENIKVVVNKIGPGEVFGEMSFVSREPRSATATAMEKSEIAMIDKFYLDKEISVLSPEMRVILRGLVERVRHLTKLNVKMTLELHRLKQKTKQAK